MTVIRKQDCYWRVILTVCHQVGFYMEAHKAIYILQSGMFTFSKAKFHSEWNVI